MKTKQALEIENASLKTDLNNLRNNLQNENKKLADNLLKVQQDWNNCQENNKTLQTQIVSIRS